MAAIEGGPESRTFSRRELLVAGAGGAAAVAAAGAGVEVAEAAPTAYPALRVTSLARLKPNRPVSFNYPLQAQPNVLIDMGQQVPGGVGPKSSIVAYSLLCQHMGCPVSYQASTRELVCPCHQTRYDPERLGSIIQGLAMTPLPRVLLRVRGNGVWAFGVTGLIYGYRSNLHPGTSVGV
jgi:arsenite oxidase small subunit